MFPDLLRDDVFRLETRRLWLRWPRAGDAALIARFLGEREVAEMTAHAPHPYPPGAAAEFVRHPDDDWVILFDLGKIRSYRPATPAEEAAAYAAPVPRLARPW